MSDEAAAAACVTVTCALTPEPLTVIIPVRCTPVFAVAVMLRVALLLPLAGETVSHVAESLIADHEEIFDVTTTANVCAVFVKFLLDVSRVREGVLLPHEKVMVLPLALKLCRLIPETPLLIHFALGFVVSVNLF